VKVNRPDEILDLNSLPRLDRPGLTKNMGGFLSECAAVCLDHNGLVFPVVLRLAGAHTAQWRLVGPVVTNQMRRAYGDLQEATEYGASGIALLIVESCEGLTILSRSPKDGGGFDYYLTPVEPAPNSTEDNFLGRATAWLEVSGILGGTTEDMQYRINARIRRLEQAAGEISEARTLPAWIVVVEFSAPGARMENYEPNP
jgi:hypothetical protein